MTTDTTEFTIWMTTISSYTLFFFAVRFHSTFSIIASAVISLLGFYTILSYIIERKKRLNNDI